MDEKKEGNLLKKFIKPHILKSYRKMIGYSTDEVSKKTGIPIDKLERSENIEVELNTQELDQISYLYRIPIGYLFLDSINEDYFLDIIKSKFKNPDDISIFLKFYRVFVNFVNEMILLGIFSEKDNILESNGIQYNYYYLLQKRRDLEDKGIYVFYIPSSVDDYVHISYDGYECYLVGVQDVYKPKEMRDLGYMRYILGDLLLNQLVQVLDDENIDFKKKIRLYNFLYNALELDLNVNTYEYFDNMVKYLKVLYARK
ncbi:MAG: hypothetical protein QXF12_04015 [Candidatus Aenigmatarchaeota archaeon]